MSAHDQVAGARTERASVCNSVMPVFRVIWGRNAKGVSEAKSVFSVRVNLIPPFPAATFIHIDGKGFVEASRIPTAGCPRRAGARGRGDGVNGCGHSPGRARWVAVVVKETSASLFRCRKVKVGAENLRAVRQTDKGHALGDVAKRLILSRCLVPPRYIAAQSGVDCPPRIRALFRRSPSLRLRVRRGEGQNADGEAGENSNSPQGEFYLKLSRGGGGQQQQQRRCIPQTASKVQAAETAHWRAMRAASWRRGFIVEAILCSFFGVKWTGKL